MTVRSASLMLALSAPVAGQGSPPVAIGGDTLALGAFRFGVSGDAKVGHRRAGLICAPAGALRWRDVEPATARAQAIAARAIRDAGVSIVTPDGDDWIATGEPSTGYRLIGEVTGVAANLCATAYGLGRAIEHGRHLKGEGRMRVEWRVYRMADHAVVARTITCAAFRFDRPDMEAADVGLVGVAGSAKLVGELLAHAPGMIALPERLGDEAECPPFAVGHQGPDGGETPR